MKFITNISTLLFLTLLIACSRVTEDNYNRIESGVEEAASSEPLVNLLNRPAWELAL